MPQRQFPDGFTGIAAGSVNRMYICCGIPGPGIDPVITAVTSIGFF